MIGILIVTHKELAEALRFFPTTESADVLCKFIRRHAP